MEGAVRNGARRRVLSLVNGAFSERFFQIAKATGLRRTPLEVEWGRGTRRTCCGRAARGDYDAVTVVHSETSTGALNPIASWRRSRTRPGDVVLLVDSVSGLCGADMRTDEWGLDFVLTGSQKSFALPPGPRVRRRAGEHPGAREQDGPRHLLRLPRVRAQHPEEPDAEHAGGVAALRAGAQVDYGSRRRASRTGWSGTAMAERTWAWCDERGLGSWRRPAFRSPTVTTIHCPTAGPARSWRRPVKAARLQIATGYGRMKDETFRIGHMGDHTLDRWTGCCSRVLDGP
jgi:aspartate aminotransferase-like enzyme